MTISGPMQSHEFVASLVNRMTQSIDDEQFGSLFNREQMGLSKVQVSFLGVILKYGTCSLRRIFSER